MRRLLLLAACCLSLIVSQSVSAQRQQASPYGPRLTEYYNSIDKVTVPHKNTKPVIGVSVTNTMKATCTRSIELAGGIPVILAVTNDVTLIDDMLDKLDGLMLSGGEDIDPSWYNEEKSEHLGGVNAKRDDFELMLFKKATDRNIPILGVCRGQQMINVAMGGTLYQDLPTEKPSDIKHSVPDETAHTVRIEAGSLLAQIVGTTELGVNSHHHQAVETLAPGLKATAWSPDGVIEAVDAYPVRQIMAVQFHPELNSAAGDPVQLKIFQHFVGQAALFAQAKDIHSRILSVDTHCDTPMSFNRGGTLSARNRQQVSIPKMKEGYLDAQYLAAFLSQREEDPASLAKAVENCDAIINSIYRETQANAAECGVAVTMEDALALKAQGKRAYFIGIENGYGLGGKLENIKRYRDMGVGYITLCHSYDNIICHSSTNTEDENLGLTDFGKKVVKEMNKRGVVIDLSHASMGTFWDVMKYSKLPVVCTHSGAKDVYFHNRNLNDDQLRALAKNGGVIQVCIFASYMGPDPSKTDIDDVVAHIDHCVKVAGIDHVGVGSDFDGGGGVLGLEGSNNMIRITEKLLEKGYSEQDIAKIWGGNFFRVLAENQKAAK